MPLDGNELTAISTSEIFEQKIDISLFMKRRETACEFWRGIPNEMLVFDYWEDTVTTGCALGWLGIAKFDIWSLGHQTTSHGKVPILQSGEIGYTAAAVYFGMNRGMASAIFSGKNLSRSFYGLRFPWQEITSEMLCKKVMQAPYYVTPKKSKIIKRNYLLIFRLNEK